MRMFVWTCCRKTLRGNWMAEISSLNYRICKLRSELFSGSSRMTRLISIPGGEGRGVIYGQGATETGRYCGLVNHCGYREDALIMVILSGLDNIFSWGVEQKNGTERLFFSFSSCYQHVQRAVNKSDRFERDRQKVYPVTFEVFLLVCLFLKGPAHFQTLCFLGSFPDGYLKWKPLGNFFFFIWHVRLAAEFFVTS